MNTQSPLVGVGTTTDHERVQNMHARVGMPVDAADGPWGELDDFVVDPTSFAIDEAAETGDALELLETGTQYDVLVTDCSMPGPPVAELVDQFRQVRPEARIILATGLSRDELRGLSERVDVHLSKPFAPEELRRALEF